MKLKHRHCQLEPINSHSQGNIEDSAVIYKNKSFLFASATLISDHYCFTLFSDFMSTFLRQYNDLTSENFSTLPFQPALLVPLCPSLFSPFFLFGLISFAVPISSSYHLHLCIVTLPFAFAFPCFSFLALCTDSFTVFLRSYVPKTSGCLSKTLAKLGN